LTALPNVSDAREDAGTESTAVSVVVLGNQFARLFKFGEVNDPRGIGSLP